MIKSEEQVVLRIHDILEETSFSWIAIASLALYLYGIICDLDEIWILVSEDYHAKINNQFSKVFRLISGLRYQETNYYTSNISSFLVNSIPLHILSGLIIKIDNYVVNPSFREIVSNSKSLPFYGVRILVPSLEWLYLYYLANPEKRDIVNKIISKLMREGINFNLLDSLLRNFPAEKKRNILKSLEKT